MGSVAKELQDRRQALNLPAGETARAVEIMFTQSLETLPKEALRLFAALGAVATHECGRLAAVALAQAIGLVSPAEAVDLLVRRALINAFTNTTLPEHSDRERLRFHPLLRALAESKFARWPEKQRQRAYRGIAHHYAAIVPRMKDEALEVDETNMIGALKWAQAHHQDALVSALCLGMMPYWYVRWRTAESLDYLPWGKAAAESVAQATNDRADHLRAADLALTYGQVLRRTGRLEQAEQFLRENLARWRQLEDQRGEGEALLVLGRISRTRGQRAEAEAYYRQSLALFRLVRHQRGEGAALVFLGELMRDEKKLEEAKRLTLEALDIHRKTHNLQAEEAALTVLGRLALEVGQLEEAEHIFAQTLKIARQVQDRQGEGVNLFMLARLALAQGEGAAAEGLYHESLAIFREVNSTFDLAEALLEIGAFLIAQRDKREEGCTMLREAIQLYASMRLPQEAVARQTLERLGGSS